MNSALDFVNRARYAWTEFRQPSQFDRSPHPRFHAENGDSHYAPAELIQPNPQLTDFRLLVGIWQDKSFTSKHGFQMNRRPQASLADRPSPNLGLYSAVCDCEIKAKRNYTSSSRLINFCYGLQIIVAAALTALGAAAASNKAVTAFGAINTCIAGFLTYLKGSGLPHRIKYFQHEWGKIREYIEQRERDFSFPNSGLDVVEEVAKIRQMYEHLRLDIESNRPERFVSSFGGERNGLERAQQLQRQRQRQQIPDFTPSSSLVRPPQAAAAAAIDDGVGCTHRKNENEKENPRVTASGLFAKARDRKEDVLFEDKLEELKELEQEIGDGGERMGEEEEGNKKEKKKKRDVVEKLQGPGRREIEKVGVPVVVVGAGCESCS